MAVVTAIALEDLYGKEVRYCSNRKEVKDHGADAGNLLGSDLHDGDRVIMVEDVTTSGKSIDETYPILKAAANVDVKGLIVSLNRMEVGKGVSLRHSKRFRKSMASCCLHRKHGRSN